MSQHRFLEHRSINS